jgi:hypothetical protein
MMLKNLRIKIFNWFAAGRLTLTYDKPQEYSTMSSYTLGGGNGLTYTTGAGSFNYPTTQPQTQVHIMNLIPSINFNVARANGGWIVQVNQAQTQQNVVSLTGLTLSDSKPPELYLIAEDAEFDKELGKIITTACLKA